MLQPKCAIENFSWNGALDLIDENVKSIYNIDILRAMKTVQIPRKNMDLSTIDNFWRHSKIEDTDQSALSNVSIDPLQIEEQTAQTAMSNLIGSDARMSIFILVNMPEEEDHCQKIFEESLVDHMIQGRGQ